MTQQEQLIAKVFDNSVNALGLMAKKVSESIEKEPSRQQLLDDFAKAAMQSLLVDTGNSVFSESFRASVATAAYDIASAMMKERERRMKG